MKYSNIFDQLGKKRSFKLNGFAKSVNQGDFCCIIGNNVRRVDTVFHLLIKTFSIYHIIGYLATNKTASRKKFFLINGNISQSQVLNSFTEIEDEINRLVTHAENPIVFINNFSSILSEYTKTNETYESKFKEVCARLKQLAVSYNVPILTSLTFDSDTAIKEFLFPFNGRGIVDYRTECFDRIYSTYKSEYSSVAGKQKLFNQFKKVHYKLSQLKPTMFVTSYEGVENLMWYDPPMPIIYIMRPFIIDRRLIPTEFNGYNVNFMQLGGTPEGFAPNIALPQEDKYAPENYINYVDNNLPMLAKELLLPNLTRDEALDALTGGFKKHIDWCVKIRSNKIEAENDNIICFTKLLYRVKQAFAFSDASKRFKNENWGYSLTATSFSLGMPLVLNFNNNVDSDFITRGNTYGPQQSYPFSNFYGIYPELTILKKMLHLLFLPPSVRACSSFQTKQ